ncbi:hypothetical protein CR513_00936, partial [Mucuna pruriens]
MICVLVVIGPVDSIGRPGCCLFVQSERETARQRFVCMGPNNEASWANISRVHTRTLALIVGQGKNQSQRQKGEETVKSNKLMQCRSPRTKPAPLMKEKRRQLCAVASLQAHSDEQLRLSAEAKQRQEEPKERYRLAEECHVEAMKMADQRDQREEELCRQIAVLRDASGNDQTMHEESPTQPLWGKPFYKEINETPIPLNFREVVVEPFDGSQDPYAHLQAFQTQMYISGGNGKLSYKLFLGTLRGVAM